MYPRSCFWYRGTSAKTTLWNRPFANPRRDLIKWATLRTPTSADFPSDFAWEKMNPFQGTLASLSKRVKVSSGSSFCPDQVVLSKNFYSRPGCRQKSLLRNCGLGGGSLSVPWSLWPQNRAAAATCHHGRCKLPAILRLTPKIVSGLRFSCGRRSEKPCDFCSGMVASPLAATVGIAILRCDFFKSPQRGPAARGPAF